MQNAPPFRSKRQILSILAIAAGCLALAAVLVLTRYLVLASLIGVGFGVLLTPVMSLMQERFKVPRALSALAMALLILGGIAGIGYGMFLLLSDQIQSLIERAPELTQTLRTQADRLASKFPWVESQLSKLNLGQAARTTLASLFQGLQTGLSAAAGFIVILTIAIYTAINSRSYFRGLLSVFPAYRRSRAAEVLKGAASTLRHWFRAQLIVMSISGAATTLGLWILGIDYWLLLGVLTGVLGFVPYVGAFLTVIAAGAVTLGSEPGKIWWVLGIYFGIQQLEGNVTMPLVMKGGVQLPEVHVIVFMLIMGSLFGLLGVFVAPPLLAVGRTIYLMTFAPEMDRRHRPPGPEAEDVLEKTGARKSA